MCGRAHSPDVTRGTNMHDSAQLARTPKVTRAVRRLACGPHGPPPSRGDASASPTTACGPTSARPTGLRNVPNEPNEPTRTCPRPVHVDPPPGHYAAHFRPNEPTARRGRRRGAAGARCVAGATWLRRRTWLRSPPAPQQQRDHAIMAAAAAAAAQTSRSCFDRTRCSKSFLWKRARAQDSTDGAIAGLRIFGDYLAMKHREVRVVNAVDSDVERARVEHWVLWPYDERVVACQIRRGYRCPRCSSCVAVAPEVAHFHVWSRCVGLVFRLQMKTSGSPVIVTTVTLSVTLRWGTCRRGGMLLRVRISA